MGEPALAPVSETLFLTLYARALESRRPDPIVRDVVAERVTEALNPRFARSPLRLHRKLAAGRLPRLLLTTLALRTRHFDRLVLDFRRRHPDGVVVSLGCGLSTRCHRLDDGTLRWVGVDLPPAIAVRRELLPDTERFTTLGASVLDEAWMEPLPAVPPDRVLFLAEGLFMYLEAASVRRLVARLRERFPGAELAAEFADAGLVRLNQTRLGRGKMRRQFGLSEDVWFASGLADAREIEDWAPGVELLGTWSHLDDHEARLGWMRGFSWWNALGRPLFVVHARLGAPRSAA